MPTPRSLSVEVQFIEAAQVVLAAVLDVEQPVEWPSEWRVLERELDRVSGLLARERTVFERLLYREADDGSVDELPVDGRDGWVLGLEFAEVRRRGASDELRSLASALRYVVKDSRYLVPTELRAGRRRIDANEAIALLEAEATSIDAAAPPVKVGRGVKAKPRR